MGRQGEIDLHESTEDIIRRLSEVVSQNSATKAQVSRSRTVFDKVAESVLEEEKEEDDRAIYRNYLSDQNTTSIVRKKSSLS